MFYPIEQQSHEYAQAEQQWLGRTHGQWCHEDCECQRPGEPDDEPEVIVEYDFYPDAEWADYEPRYDFADGGRC